MNRKHFTDEELAEFSDVFAELDQARGHLVSAAQKMSARGYPQRADKVLDAAQLAVGQKELIVQDWRDRSQRPSQSTEEAA